MAPQICSNCGAEVPSNARACPECGADEETGWSDHATVQRLDLPDADFDYEEFVAREFEGREPRRRGPQRLWWFVALGLLIAFVVVWLIR